MHDHFDPALLIPLAGIALPLFLVPTIMAMKFAQRKREWEHLERMKAFELGRPLPTNQAWPALAVVAIGAIMPIGVFMVACFTSLQQRNPHGEIFGPAAFVAVCGVWASAYLGKRLFAERSPKLDPYDLRNKQPVDPEAFDVVGRRG